MNGYKYYCVLSGPCGVVSATHEATLTVNPSSTITSHPRDTVSCPGRIPFRVVVSGPVISYQWQENSGSGWVNLTDGWYYSGSTTSTVLAYKGYGTSGLLYRCIVTTPCGVLTSSAGRLDVFSIVGISSHPVSDTVCSGGTATFSVVASGTGTVSYRWYKIIPGVGTYVLSDGSGISGSGTSVLTVSSVPLSMDGTRFYCVVRDTCSATASFAGMLRVVTYTPLMPSVQPANATVCAGSTATFSTVIPGAGLGSTYYWYVKPPMGSYTLVTATPPYSGVNTPTLTVSPAATGMNGYKYYCVLSGPCGVVSATHEATLTVNPSSTITSHPHDTVSCPGFIPFSVTVGGAVIRYQWQRNTGTGWVDLAEDWFFRGTTTATLQASSDFGDTGIFYRCVITTPCGEVLSSAARLDIFPILQITSHPRSDTVCPRSTVTFSVAASGSGTLRYRWYKVPAVGSSGPLSDGGAYSGTSTPTLTISGVNMAMDGDKFSCSIDDTCTSITSYNATLNIAMPVELTPSVQPGNDTTCAGGIASFSTVVPGAGSDAIYYWYKKPPSGSYSPVMPLSPYSGVYTSTLTISPVSVAMNGYTFLCVVGNSCGRIATTREAVLVLSECDTPEYHISLTSEASELVAYPNPLSGKLINFKVEEFRSQESKIRIIDRYGETVTSALIKFSAAGIATMDIPDLKPGIYTASIYAITENKTRSIVFLKQ